MSILYKSKLLPFSSTPGNITRIFSNRTFIMEKPVETLMTKKLKEAFDPQHLEVINESSRHGVPKGSETHFKVVVVSSHFDNVGILERHRMVNKVLDDEINGPVHALSIVAKTLKQWEESDKNVEPSPNCRGGFGK